MRHSPILPSSGGAGDEDGGVAENNVNEGADNVDHDLTYQTYLRIPELLALQSVRSQPPHPEELHFIVTHQAIELWFKLVLHDVARVIQAVDADEWTGAVVLLRRVNDVLDIVMRQLRVLQDMPPWAFHEFRSYLGTASGTQSVQFREIEVLSGLHDEEYVKALRALHPDSELPAEVVRRLSKRSLADAHRDAGARLGIGEDDEAWANFYVESGPTVPFYLLCEALLDYDERFLRLRFEHLVLVERALGGRVRGTGGTAITYLQRTTKYRFFPVLWELRNALSLRGGGTLAR
jgi:tryptophan 2,3-dioxygenase